MKLRILTIAAAMAAIATTAAARDYSKSEHLIAMRDGTRLYTAVYKPADMAEGEKSPILYLRTPYGCRPYGQEPAKFLND